jgi:hypothetical protein
MLERSLKMTKIKASRRGGSEAYWKYAAGSAEERNAEIRHFQRPT